jgi:ribosomal protein S18 acetylase RimI-like enzyme
MTLSKRQATEADREFVQAVHHRAYRDVVERQYGRWDETAQEKYFETAWIAVAHEIILCDNLACGYCSIEFLADEVFVQELVIDPEFQGRGIGTRIMEEVIAEAVARGIPVRLQTHIVNRAAELYRRLGFRERVRTSTHIVMEWSAV